MLRLAAAFLSGALFGLGLVVSQMVNPDKVLSFLDLAGRWDPSLAVVMAGALGTTFIGYRLALRRPAPLFDTRFHLPTARELDVRLVTGAVLFGIGWGLVGFCPGPALTSLAFGLQKSFIFVGAMLAGAGLYWIVGPGRSRTPVIQSRTPS